MTDQHKVNACWWPGRLQIQCYECDFHYDGTDKETEPEYQPVREHQQHPPPKTHDITGLILA